ncbi:MAG: hypothetical protein ACLPSW_16890 [Roseiarcus sp.]
MAHANPQPSRGATGMSVKAMPIDPQSALSALHANQATPGGATGAGQTKMDGFDATTTDGFSGMQVEDAAALIALAGQPLQ